MIKNKNLTVCFTGHRENKYNFKENKDIILKALDVAIEEAINKGYKYFFGRKCYRGRYMGWENCD